MTDSEFTSVILRGDCLEVLKKLPDHSVDAIVTDPPYGLGTREPSGEDITRYINGESLDTGGDFMSTDWEIPSVAVWKEVLRVLKPGGYVLAFAGTRTWDIMSMGLRAAGFDNRDTIASIFGPSVLQWVHGQGFPKSLNIAKAIAKLPIPDAEEVAKRWLGYGTSLKPAWEPILCFRSPTEASTVAEQFVATGTGGINIDGTRVKHANAADLASHQAMVAALKAKGGSLGNSWKNSSDLSGANDVKEGGRWPSNVIVTHAADCKKTGTRKVDAPVINRFTDGMKPFGNGAGHEFTSTQTGDADGKEEVSVYECSPGCPVAVMNGQSGEGHAGHYPGARGNGGVSTSGHAGQDGLDEKYIGSGGASRFFAQFTPDAPFFYAAKASRAERNAGLVKKKKKSVDGGKIVTYALKEDVEADTFVEIEEAMRDRFEFESDREAFDLESFGLVEQAMLECLVPENLREHFEAVERGGNDHPTVKPLALMQYLVRLVTPPGGVVLDPYCGSGTTCKAAVEEDRKYVGIEMDPHFYDLAVRRVQVLENKKREKTLEQDAANFANEMA